jgi:hypothetical protein
VYIILAKDGIQQLSELLLKGDVKIKIPVNLSAGDTSIVTAKTLQGLIPIKAKALEDLNISDDIVVENVIDDNLVDDFTGSSKVQRYILLKKR